MATTPQINLAELKNRKLGRVLTKLGKVSREQVQEALDIQKTKKAPIGEILVELGYVTKRDVLEALAGQQGLSFYDLSGVDSLEQEAVDAVPAETAQAYQVVPITFQPKGRKIEIALKDPNNFRAIDDLRLLMGFNVTAFVADPADVDRLLKKHFSRKESVTDVVSAMASDEKFASLVGRGASIDLDAVLEAAEDSKIIKLPNLVLMQAIKDRASDIHFEPFEDEFKMRLPHRRRPLRDGAPAQAPRPGDHQPNQGHVEPRHRRARLPQDGPSNSGRGPPGGPARQRPADDVRRVGGHARARPLQRRVVDRPRRLLRTTSRSCAADREAQRHRDRDRPHGFGQDDHPLRGGSRRSTARGQDPDRRRPSSTTSTGCARCR